MTSKGRKRSRHQGSRHRVARGHARPRPLANAASLWALPLIEAAPVGFARIDLAGAIQHCTDTFARIAGNGDVNHLLGQPLVDVFARGDRDDLKRQLSKLVMGTAKSLRINGLAAEQVGACKAKVAGASLALIGFPLAERGDVNGLGVCIVAEMERAVDGGALAQQQKMQAVGQLAGGIAHDFNNLLTAMLGFCDLLLTRHQPEDPSHDEIIQVRDNALRAAGLVRQLLAFSRKQKLSPVRLTVERALANLETLVSRLLGPAIDFRLELGSGVGDVEVDLNQFDQIIVNLAANARDAMPGGGTLLIRTRRMHLKQSSVCAGETIPAGDYVAIEVSDTGVGIPREIIDHIFEPFFTTKDVGSGTGLGLATVYGIVRQTGGFICCESALGEGTTFTVMLPAAVASASDSPPPQVTTEAGRSQPAGGDGKADSCAAVGPPVMAAAGRGDCDAKDLKATVLLVDDEDPIRVFAARALRRAGLRVLEAVSGEQALEVLAVHSEPIDLLVTDVLMPDMDGYTLAQLARRDHAHLRVIAMSGFQEDGMLDRCLDDAAMNFLPKPFTLAELTSAVTSLLDSRDGN